MPSPTYELFREAMAGKKQIVCTYNGLRREVCPVILGHSRVGEEKALTYQFGGDTSSVLPAAAPSSQARRCCWNAAICSAADRPATATSGKPFSGRVLV